jgi:hypothetical protein
MSTRPSTIAKPPSTTRAGDHEKAAHHSKVAHGHHLHATEHHEEAAKMHAAEHGA